MSQHILVFNSGSSSIKFQLLDLHSPSVEPEVVGLIEKIGEPVGHIDITVGEQNQQLDESIPDHSAGLKHAFDMMQHMGASLDDLYGVGHRVVQGGDVFTGPQIVDDSVLKGIKDLIPLAPLHNPAELVGIEVAMDLLPGVPQVAVFDTSFFNTMPEKAYRYAIPKKLADDNGIRRYGFHGTSHEYVSKKVPPLLGKPTGEVNQITLHLGNGASAAAIRGGKAEDTTMGLTPLAGLVMGTRSGDIDPSILFHLSRQAGLDVDQLDTLLNRESGVKGISGVNDFRELAKLVAQGDANAIAAYEIYIYQMRRFIGSYMLNLGRIDAITFTAGVGENDAAVRRDALADLEHFGIKIDDERNNAKKTSEGRLISTDDSEVKVFVIPTNEELAIAQITGERVSSAG